MDPDVAHDPIFQGLLLKFAQESRKLHEAAGAMRSFYLKRHERPLDETADEKWRGALLGEEACLRHRLVESAAADLLRYAFELAPHSNDGLHLEELMKLKMAHRERVERRSGWAAATPHPRGIEEQVHIDGGHPVTWVIHPKSYEFTERARKRREAAEGLEPAIPPGDSEDSPDTLDDVECVE